MFLGLWVRNERSIIGRDCMRLIVILRPRVSYLLHVVILVFGILEDLSGCLVVLFHTCKDLIICPDQLLKFIVQDGYLAWSFFYLAYILFEGRLILIIYGLFIVSARIEGSIYGITVIFISLNASWKCIVSKILLSRIWFSRWFLMFRLACRSYEPWHWRPYFYL